MEVEGKIRGRAMSRIDQAVAEQLKKGQDNFKVKLLDPMRKLNLEPTAVDMETTNGGDCPLSTRRSRTTGLAHPAAPSARR